MASGNIEHSTVQPQRSSEDDDEDSDDLDELQPLSGMLNKWTNYLHGWQPRYFILSEGNLAYFKSETDTAFGCRGSIKIGRAVIQSHDFDECRFEVCVNDCVWYLRVDEAEERQRWMEALEAYKAESGYGSQTDLRRHGSVLSLTSNRSLASGSSFKTARGLKEKLAELETFRDIVCRQIDSLQTYFDSCAARASPGVHDKTLESEDLEELESCETVNDSLFSCQEGASLDGEDEKGNNDSSFLDFKGEALTFKATTSGILSTLQHCIEVMQQREESWKKRLDKETERRKRYEEQYKTAIADLEKVQSQKSRHLYGGPDFEEGPNSALNEEEWHDAVDAALDKEDREDERIQRLLTRNSSSYQAEDLEKMSAPVSLKKAHPLYHEIQDLTKQQLTYAKAGVEGGVWQLFAEDGEMKMYKRDVEIDGMVCDPLKAVHNVTGVTAWEYCHYFFESEYKLDWDTTLEKVVLVERESDDCLIFHQLHKRVWPASQRESLFWSHFRRVDAFKDPDAHDLYIVCNHDLDRPDVPVQKGNLRVGLTVAMVCQTVISGSKQLSQVTREDITCRIIYVAQVNPGGWAPASALRIVYKREYPKFLKRFTHYVLEKARKKSSIRF